MRPLVINDAVRTRLRELDAKAAQNAMRAEDMVQLATAISDGVTEIRLSPDLKGIWDMLQRNLRDFTTHLDHGFQVTLTHEGQPSPAGMCRHLSISIDRPGKLPHPAAIAMIMEEIGFAAPLDDPHTRIWLEPIAGQRNHEAVNVLQPVSGKWEHE